MGTNTRAVTSWRTATTTTLPTTGMSKPAMDEPKFMLAWLASCVVAPMVVSR